MTNITTHFTWEEFACKDGTPVPANLRPGTTLLCEQLEVLRAYTGKSIHIISGYRTPAHNAAVPRAAANSRHLQADAADFEVEGMRSSEAWCTVKQLIERGAMRPGGLGYYGELSDNHIHYDTGPARSWNNSGGPYPVCRPLAPPVERPNKEEEDMRYVAAVVDGTLMRVITNGPHARWVTKAAEDAYWVGKLGEPEAVDPDVVKALLGR